MIAVSNFDHERQQKGDFLISTDVNQLDLDVIHGFLTNAYWCQGISREIVARSIAHSLCFGLYEHHRQIGFARVISDFATCGYIADVFILKDYRGRGLAKWLMEAIMRHPQLQGLRRWTLATRDAHGLYAKFGFKALNAPARWMEILDQGVYQQMPLGENS